MHVLVGLSALSLCDCVMMKRLQYGLYVYVVSAINWADWMQSYEEWTVCV